MLVPFFLDKRTVLDAQRVPHEVFLIVSMRQWLEKTNAKSNDELETLSIRFQGWSTLNLLSLIVSTWTLDIGTMNPRVFKSFSAVTIMVSFAIVVSRSAERLDGEGNESHNRAVSCIHGRHSILNGDNKIKRSGRKRKSSHAASVRFLNSGSLFAGLSHSMLVLPVISLLRSTRVRPRNGPSTANNPQIFYCPSDTVKKSTIHAALTLRHAKLPFNAKLIPFIPPFFFYFFCLDALKTWLKRPKIPWAHTSVSYGRRELNGR